MNLNGLILLAAFFTALWIMRAQLRPPPPQDPLERAQITRLNRDGQR